MKYLVTVRRKEYREHVFTIEASSKLDAEALALSAADDHDFSENSVDYADEDVVEIKEISD